MAERFDAAIVGAGADGLAAAALLAGAGLRVIVLERGSHPGGRLVTREFHPGFFASPFADDVAPVPDELFWSLDLARHGALHADASFESAIWPDGIVSNPPGDLRAEAGRRRAAALAHARRLEAPSRARLPFLARDERLPWPREDWTHRALADIAAERSSDPREAALLAAGALAGRAADPMVPGSALHLLAPGQGSGGVWRGGLGGLGDALAAGARAAGAELDCGVEVTDIRCRRGRASAVVLADGREIAARAVISTLDLKRTFLSLFAWSDLPKPLVRQIGDFRISGATARLHVALSAPPEPAAEAPPGFLRGPIHVMPGLDHLVEAYAAWRSGTIADHLPIALRFASTVDPALAPLGACVMTATIGCVPHTLFDGAWSHDKRDRLSAHVLGAIAKVFPGIIATIQALKLLVPPDMAEALGATEGDLWGGEIAPDQIFGFRPWQVCKSPYTPVEGLYLAGPSASASLFGTCAAGAAAADAVLADLRAGHLP